MEEQIAIQNKLHERLSDIRSRNPTYSLRAFSRKLQISSSALSEILNGKRRISKKIASRIIERLSLGPEEMTALLDLFPERTQRITQNAQRVLQISVDRYRLIAGWHHFAILSVAETEGFQSSPAWIGKRLGISEKDASDAIERLKRLDMIHTREDGSLAATGISYHSTDGVPNPGLRLVQHQNLELAKKSLDRDPLGTRDFTALTLAIDPEKFDEARQMIRRFRSRMQRLFENGRKKEVYKLCIQFIPVTREVGDDDEEKNKRQITYE